MPNVTPMAQAPVIVGAGLAGIAAALSLAPMPVTLISARPLGVDAASAWAQGGIAAALGADDHSDLHAADTLNAGAGLCDAAMVRLVTAGAPNVIDWLKRAGVVFDPAPGLEGAHSRRRILHAGGDGSGAAIMQALIEKVRATPSITVLENVSAVQLLADDRGVAGVVVARGGAREVLAADRVVLATGGAGGLWQHTTNPRGALGQGVALAARLGARLADMEFMQFHPTAMDIGVDPMPLASEALRGEGATLVDETGSRFTDELQPRDIVARSIAAHVNAGHKVFLDARDSLGARFAARFPAIHALCIKAGIDPAIAPIPVRPAAHYHMGGVAVDEWGRSSVGGLWACGEVACTGLHGANRLASNSLLEAAFFGRRVAQDIAATPARKIRVPPLPPPRTAGADHARVRAIMSAHVGLMRDRAGLQKAADELAALATQNDAAFVAQMMAAAALRRAESRGAHARRDFPQCADAWAQRQFFSPQEFMKSAVFA